MVDCLCGLAVILAKQMRVNPQRNVGLRMARTLADCHDINARVDELAGMSVAQAMEGHIGQSVVTCKVTPSCADGATGERAERSEVSVGLRVGVCHAGI